PGPLRRDRLERGARPGRPPRLRQVANDRRSGACPIRDYSGGRRAGDRRGSARTRGDGLGAWPAPADLRDPAPPAPRRLPEAPAVRRNVLLVDVGIAILAAIVLLIITPGLAVAA